MNSYKLIIFDLDGTLLDTVEEITASMNDMLTEFDLPNVSLEQARNWVGKGAPHFLEQYLEHHPLPLNKTQEQLLARFYYYYEKRSGTGSALYPGVKDSLEKLSVSDIKLTVVTNKFKLGADKVLSSHQLSHYFEDVIGGDTFEHKKPNPVAVHHLIQKHSVLPEQVLFVGDSMTDVSTAKNAGVKVWAVPYGYNHGQPIATAAPDRVMREFSEVLDVLL
ncbi:MAG: phosphoglycolate phosphatase [Nitrincola sp.]|nr:phosphoglycolate phosphatase [Nitrincola sp.]